MKILITGASGFVGGALLRRCRELGWETLGVGRRPLPDADYRSVDLTRPFQLDFEPDVVVHAAARSSPWGSRREFERQNVTATQNVRAFCEAHGNPRLVYISTSAVFYREEHQFDISEDTPLPERAINEYARTKLAGEALVRGYGGRWSILRPRAVFGPGDTVVFPRIIRAARGGRLPVIESDTEVMGDLVYIDTLVDYIVRAIERGSDGCYNLTNSQPVAILPFLRDVLARLGYAMSQKTVSAARAMRYAGAIEAVYAWLPFLGEPPITRFGVSVFAYSKTFNSSRTVRDLGPPSVSIDEGIARFVAWQKVHP